ncbi:MAG: glycosyltransferase [Chlorobium sp.]|nr:MAG: glycosyltransferase [Chlorobium sp.]
MLYYYQILVLFLLMFFLGLLLRNLIDFSFMPQKSPYAGPLVSVLVPARNEALNIERCVRSLLQQDYGVFEIIVLDDGSTDKTPELLDGLMKESAGRLQILRGEALPDGWHGKTWACFQLSRMAKGELLLFTDADTMHKSDALRRSVGSLMDSGSDMLSIMPHQELGSFWEKLLVPLIHVILLCYLPIRLVRTSPNPAFSFANGQFILFRRDFYERIDGHAAVRNAIVEDVWLCRAVKKAGGRVAAYNGSDIVSCRMYRNFKEIWEGFSKNLFAAIGYSTPGLFMLVTVIAALYVAPYLFIASSVLMGDFSVSMFWLPFFQITVAIICRLAIARVFHQSLILSLLHVISQSVLIAIAINSFMMIKYGKGAYWKGRNYNFS